ncbi:MAG: hypothetical protein R3E39_07025 [Anaerolineae bacterium]
MNPTDVLKYGHQHVLRTLDGLSRSTWETGGVCGVWSVKDIIGHLAAYELMLSEVLAPFAEIEIEPKILPQIGNIGIAAFNDVQAASRHGKTVSEVLREYEDTATYNVEKVAIQISSPIWSRRGTLPWYGDEYSLDDYIVYTFYGHKREHCAQIDVYKDTFIHS